jgi:uncharacterized protein YkwD
MRLHRLLIIERPERMKGFPQMKISFVRLFILISVFALVTSTARSQTSKSQPPKDTSGSLSEAERDLLKEINQARANPQTYAAYLEKMKPLFKGKQYTATGDAPLTTEEGWTAVEEAIRFLRAAKPSGPLNPSRGLSLAALAHVTDQSGSGMTGHQGTKSGMIEDRVKPFGNWQGGIGENITYGNDSARERLLTWLIDDGFPSRGHRMRLMSSDYKVAGVSCGSHPQFSAMCVLTLAGGFVDVPAGVTATNSKTSETKPKPTNSKTTRKM